MLLFVSIKLDSSPLSLLADTGGTLCQCVRSIRLPLPREFLGAPVQPLAIELMELHPRVLGMLGVLEESLDHRSKHSRSRTHVVAELSPGSVLQ